MIAAAFSIATIAPKMSAPQRALKRAGFAPLYISLEGDLDSAMNP
jgi:hypothetical protein